MHCLGEADTFVSSSPNIQTVPTSWGGGRHQKSHFRRSRHTRLLLYTYFSFSTVRECTSAQNRLLQSSELNVQLTSHVQSGPLVLLSQYNTISHELDEQIGGLAEDAGRMGLRGWHKCLLV